MSRDSTDYTHGSTGTKPSSAIDFADGDKPDPDRFDWWINFFIEAINGHADEFDVLDSDADGIVDEADYANDADASTYKGNDIDSNGDGKVDSAVSADDATTLQSNTPADLRLEIEDDGSVVDSSVPNLNFGTDITVTDDGDGTYTLVADTIGDTHTNVSDDGSVVVTSVDDINFGSNIAVTDDGDGSVTVTSDDDATSYKGNDIDTDGDGKVNSADTADSADAIQSIDPFVDFHTPAQSGVVADGDAHTLWVTELSDGATLKLTQTAFINANGTAPATGVDYIIATLDGNGGYTQQTAIHTGDGSTTYLDVEGSVSSPVASYTNSSGGPQMVALLVENASGSKADVMAEATVVED